MSERWRSKAARDLVRAVRAAGGSVERQGRGKLLITGPAGTTVITEPHGETRPDLRRYAPAVHIRDATGLKLD